MGFFNTLLVFDAMGDLAQHNPLLFLQIMGVIVWIVCGLISIAVVADAARKKDCLPVYRIKWLRFVAFFLPLLFWTGMLVYALIFHIILDETGERKP